MGKTELFFKVLELKKIKKSEYIFDKNTKLKKVFINSKEVMNEDLFVAIRGGNNFVNEALEKGAYVVYDNENVLINEKFKDRSFLVKDSIIFLQEFSKAWRKKLDIKVIAITGSNGKTTVKDMIYHFLNKKYKVKKTEGNLNNHIGLPLTLLRAEEDDDFIILEMGMSGFGEIDLLGCISNPNIAIITNIGESHLEFLKSKENVFKAKTEILPYIKNTLIINGDDLFLKDIKNEGIEIIEVLNDKNFCDDNMDKEVLYYGDIKFDENGTKYIFKDYNNKKTQEEYTTNVLGEHNILNLTLAIAVAKKCSVEDYIIKENLLNISLTNMRFQKIEKKDIIYINDAYNASPMSMVKSMETFSPLYKDKLKIMILGDMLELGENEIQYHINLLETVRNTESNKVYLYGNRMKYLYEKLFENRNLLGIKEKDIKFFETKENIAREIKSLREDKVILLKGSRGMKLEEIIDLV